MWFFAYLRFFEKTGGSYELRPCLLEQEKEHDEIFEDNWDEKEKELLPFLKNDVLSTALSYARY